MAKVRRHLVKPWLEVAPSLIDLPLKCSCAPNLETISEEYEDGDDDD
ncbi:hypothetical protein WN944_027867 [Citrus x changshan-huyou]|uniref:Uncharacterized protein n=1 Tax=Citrus x changshan-huyou TaxID=2935761 RepID=A0AAP0LKT1_9ROSI